MTKKDVKDYAIAVGCVAVGLYGVYKGLMLLKSGMQDIANSLKSNDDLDYDEEE